MVKEKAVLCGPFLGEMFWEFFRFVPYIVWKRQKHYLDPSIKFIILTREDRFDMYGQMADILVPLRIEDDKYIQDCYRLIDYPQSEYDELVKSFYDHFSNRFYVVERIKPDIFNRRNYLNKDFYPKPQMRYQYFPRQENLKLVEQYVPNKKEIVVLAPRFRKGLRRNWIYWDELYELLYRSYLYNDFNFVICGKKNDYVEDSKKRFFDINDIPLNQNSSLIGVTIETLKKSVLTIGSQSAIPNISSLLGTQVLEWGDQRHYHTVTYNIFKTKITYLDDPKYNISPDIVLSKIETVLEERRIRDVE